MVESAAERIRGLPRPAGAEVVVLGDTAYDTAYDTDVVQQACRERGDIDVTDRSRRRRPDPLVGTRP